MNAVPYVREEEVYKLIDESKLLIIYFTVDWCGSCKIFNPLVDQLAEQYLDRARVIKFDVDANRIAAKNMGISGMPTIFIFQNSKLVKTIRGAVPYKYLNGIVGKFM